MIYDSAILPDIREDRPDPPHPAPGSTLGANGAAVSTLAKVLRFDLVCLTAAICGLGHAPALLIHDSPKEADMEDAL